MEKNVLSQDRFDMVKRALEVFEEKLNLSEDKDFGRFQLIFLETTETHEFQGIIHSDFNETNILINRSETGDLEVVSCSFFLEK